jgi:hypothetical protein
MVFGGERFCGYQCLWVTAIGLGIRGLVGPRRGDMLGLEPGSRSMRLVRGSLLFGRGLVLNTARAAAVGNVAGVGYGASLNN